MVYRSESLLKVLLVSLVDFCHLKFIAPFYYWDRFYSKYHYAGIPALDSEQKACLYKGQACKIRNSEECTRKTVN